MFKLVKLRSVIRIPPSMFGSDLNEIANNILREKLMPRKLTFSLP